MTSSSEEVLPCAAEGCDQPRIGLYCSKHAAEVVFEDAVVKPRHVPRDLYMRLYRRRARAQGRCYDCTRPALPGKSRCKRHFEVGLGVFKRRRRKRLNERKRKKALKSKGRR